MRPHRLLLLALTLAACAPTVTSPGGRIPNPPATTPARTDSVVLTVPKDTATAPQRTPDRWWMLDHDANGVYGASVDRAYRELLAGRQPKRSVVVAIIDSGVDTAHVDLHGNLWTNPREIPGNGKDDDNNGYADDVHGWDFIGGPGGKAIGKDTYEVTRLFALCKAGSTPPLTKCDEVKAEFTQKRTETEEQIAQIRTMNAAVDKVVAVLKRELSPDTLTEARVAALKPIRTDVGQAQQVYMQLAANNITPAMIKEELKRLEGDLEFGLNPEYNPRTIVGDNYQNPNERIYGNTNIVGPDPAHGTGVAGIIGALRDNGLGVDGIAAGVKLMVVRTVPDGDERDKDVANAIRYAVDNGANIINMSFGKSFSPFKNVVDDAVRYADEKGVLMIHAAGNEGKNLDSGHNFPTRVYLDGGIAKNWIEVGATGWKGADQLAAEYSNYGLTQVDLFAPGSDVKSTAPGNAYEAHSGTSFASPVVAGIAALIMSHYPALTAADVRRIIIESATPLKDLTVQRPGADTTVKFGELSGSGAIINAFNALKLAEKVAATRTY